MLDEYEDWGLDAHSASWISVRELELYNYNQIIEDRRVTQQIGPNAWDGGRTAEPGGGKKMTLREFLGDQFFEGVRCLKACNADRIVFWFDN